MPTRRPRTSHRSPCPGRASRDTRSMGLREPITAGKGGNPPPPGTHGVGRAQPRGQWGAAGGGAGGRRGEAVLCASFIQSMCLGGCHPVAGCCYRELPHRREALSCRAEKFKNLSRRGHSAITCRLHRTTSHPLPPAFSTKLPEPPWIRARPHRTRPGLAGSWGAGGTQSRAQKPASNAGGFTVPEAAGGASSISPSGFSKRWSEFFLPTYLVLISSVRSRLLPLAGTSEHQGFQRLPLGSTQRAGVQVLD